MSGWNLSTAKAAPVGAASLLAAVVVGVSCLTFDLLMQMPTASITRWGAAVFIVAAYLLFAPAVAGSLYSVLFENSRVFGLAALALAALDVLTMPSAQMLDGLLLLPLWFLGIMGVIKFIRWRGAKQLNVPDLNP